MEEEAETLRRKRKLQEIREKALKAQTKVTTTTGASTTVPTGNALKSDDNSKEVKESTVEKAHSIVARKTEDIIKAELQSLQSEEMSIAPKKINWDLKKQIEPKIEKLRKRTQKAIVEILREKLLEAEE